MSIIQLKNIEKKYGERVVFEGVDLEIDEGAFVFLSGESGAGKTTLLNVIGGLEASSGGQVVVCGQEVSKMSAKERVEFYRHKIGIVFQGSYLQPQLSLAENIALPGVFAGAKKKVCRQRVEELAKILGITENLRALPKDVSGGQAERACIARALLLEPKIILADEPTNGLDESNARIVLGILDQIRQKLGVTVIVASHNREVYKLATQIVVVKDGKVGSMLMAPRGSGNDAQRGF